MIRHTFVLIVIVRGQLIEKNMIFPVNNENFSRIKSILEQIWTNQHNRIAEKLKELNPTWDDEQLYQEARRIIIAQIQFITVNEYLPLLIGKETMDKYKIINSFDDFTNLYDETIDPNTLNSFAAGIGEFSFSSQCDRHHGFFQRQHLMSIQRVPSFDESSDAQMFIIVCKQDPFFDVYRNIDKYKIINSFDDFTNLYDETIDPNTLNSFAAGIGEFFLTMRSSSWILSTSTFNVDTERSLLYESVSDPGLHAIHTETYASVLPYKENTAAFLLHRGRDHGIPGYVKWREYCGGGKVSDFNELKNIVIDPHHLLPILTSLYRSVEDVDLLVLALAEKPVRGSLVGPTLGCILALQYQKVTQGDRFWFANNIGEEAFTLPQLQAITSGTKMANIMCKFLGINARVQPNAFLINDEFEKKRTCFDMNE
ncbi:animal hem peroxidase [Dictyocaulus viviparus]|uniref:Animal hem peroxidase n=1 Tax=Dictyocaulus viviparus TaxID=29172 RepID=A0A0D8Y209_DICVI|nr:animal hem peroxidase [Dictyocaulus viviparus]